MSARFASAYPKVRLTRSKMLTLDNRLLCAGAGAASFDAALAIIEYFGGRWLAQTVARYFVLDNIRPSQAAYAIPAHLIASDRKIAEADRWIRANISQKITVAELAGHIGMSERTFHRRLVASTGLSPRHYVQTIRIEMAKTLALSTSLTHDQIAAATGYLDTNAFRRAFKSQLGMTVNAFRNRAPPRAGGLDKSAEVFQRPGAQGAGRGRLR
jgi:transcriptional regulator GlxA family with amidase domain